MSSSKNAKLAINSKKDGKQPRYVLVYKHVLKPSGAWGLRKKFVPEDKV